MKKIQKHIFILIGILFISTAVYAAWSTPSSTPPGGNISLPIHKIVNPQTKDGGLSVQKVLAMANSTISGQAFFNGALFGNTNTISIGGVDSAGVIQSVETIIKGVLQTTNNTTTLSSPTITNATSGLCADSAGILVRCTTTNTTSYGKLIVDPNYPTAEIQNIRISSSGAAGSPQSILSLYNSSSPFKHFNTVNSTAMPATGTNIVNMKKVPIAATTILWVRVKTVNSTNKGSISGIDDQGNYQCKNLATGGTKGWTHSYFSNFVLDGTDKFVVVYNPNTLCMNSNFCGTVPGDCKNGATAVGSGSIPSCVSGLNPNGTAYDIPRWFTSWECTAPDSSIVMCSAEDSGNINSCAPEPFNP